MVVLVNLCHPLLVLLCSLGHRALGKDVVTPSAGEENRCKRVLWPFWRLDTDVQAPVVEENSAMEVAIDVQIANAVAAADSLLTVGGHDGTKETEGGRDGVVEHLVLRPALNQPVLVQGSDSPGQRLVDPPKAGPTLSGQPRNVAKSKIPKAFGCPLNGRARRQEESLKQRLLDALAICIKHVRASGNDAVVDVYEPDPQDVVRIGEGRVKLVAVDATLQQPLARTRRKRRVVGAAATGQHDSCIRLGVPERPAVQKLPVRLQPPLR
jgi:hypothetical protein